MSEVPWVQQARMAAMHQAAAMEELAWLDKPPPLSGGPVDLPMGFPMPLGQPGFLPPPWMPNAPPGMMQALQHQDIYGAPGKFNGKGQSAMPPYAWQQMQQEQFYGNAYGNGYWNWQKGTAGKGRRSNWGADQGQRSYKGAAPEEEKKRQRQMDFEGLASALEEPEKFAKALERDSKSEGQLLERVLVNIHALSLEARTCRRVQDLFEHLKEDILERLVVEWAIPKLTELYESPTGNYVLAKAIEVARFSTLQLILDEVLNKGPLVVARHRYGCRVIERLIEQCSEVDVAGMISLFVENSAELARHQFGNFIIQHLLMHNTDERRKPVVDLLLPEVGFLAVHRTASHVVQRAMTYSGPEIQSLVCNAVVDCPDPTSPEIGANRYGSFVLEEFPNMDFPGRLELIARQMKMLLAAPKETQDSIFYPRVLEKLRAALDEGKA